MKKSMSKKKLVVSGCSYTAGIVERDENGRALFLTDPTKNVNLEFPLWPKYLGEMLNMDVVNVGLGGIGNEFIYNRIVDELSSTKDVGFAVACWSSHDRWDFNSFSKFPKSFRIDPQVKDSLEGQLLKTKITDKLRQIIDMLLERKMVSTEYNFFKSLRWFNAFQNYCDSNNIPYIQCSAFNTLSSDVISLMLDHPIFYKMNEDHFYGWPMFSQIGGFNLSDKLNEVDPEMKKLRVSDEDTHPNTEGHKVIAELLYSGIVQNE